MDDLRLSIVPWLGKTTKLIRLFIDSELDNHGFTISAKQWLILCKLSEKPGLKQRELAFLTNRSKTSLTRLIQTMEHKGLVIRKGDKNDGRAKRIYLSSKGKEVYAETVPLVSRLFAWIERDISKKDLADTRRVLLKIQQNITTNFPIFQTV